MVGYTAATERTERTEHGSGRAWEIQLVVLSEARMPRCADAPSSISIAMSVITGTTQLLGVIGDPVEHSLSPLMQNAAITKIGVDFVYLPFPVKAENLETAIAGLYAIGVRGFNVTIPHKQTIIPFLSEWSNIAQSVGAVNTVWRTEKGWYGTNTDVEGFLAPLLAQKQNWQETEAVILGNGGAARAVVAGCSQLKCRKIHVIGRHWEKLQQFQQSWQTATTPVEIEVHLWEELPDLLPQTGLLVNTTPIGMGSNADASPVEATQMQWLPAGAIAYDLIYTPRPTKFLQTANSHGIATIDGLEMLVQQGASALRRWLQQDVPVTTMRETLQEHLATKNL